MWMSLLSVVTVSLAGLVNLVILFVVFVQFRSLSMRGLHQQTFPDQETEPALVARRGFRD
jgi:hypothetical protein